MLKRLFVSNYRGLDNFEFKPEGLQSALLIGKNGSGKSTLASVLRIFQAIGRGTNRVDALVSPFECSFRRMHLPTRFEIEAFVEGQLFHYTLVLAASKFDLTTEPPPQELRVHQEKLTINGAEAFLRERGASPDAYLDWGFVALPMMLFHDQAKRMDAWRKWLAQMVILAPIPKRMHGNSSNESLWPEPDGSNFADWLSGLLSRHPMAVAPLIEYARAIIPDFAALHAVPTGRDSKMWAFSFGAPGGPASSRFELKFEELSDGEKCTFVCAALVAANLSYGPVFTFWDEPDNYLALPEVAHFIRALRGAFAEQGQIVITTHNAEAIGTFAREDVFLMIRNGHLEPSLIRTISQEEANGDLVGAYRRGELG